MILPCASKKKEKYHCAGLPELPEHALSTSVKTKGVAGQVKRAWRVRLTPKKLQSDAPKNSQPTRVPNSIIYYDVDGEFIGQKLLV